LETTRVLRRFGMTVWLTLSPGLAAPLSSQVPLLLGEVAPDFTLKQLAGGEASLSQFRGRPVLVNFWASWCKPCKAEMPEIISAYQTHRDAGLEVLAVNLTDQERMKDVRKFTAEVDLPFTVLLDQKGKVRERYGLTAVPTSIFIDAAGVMRMIHSGPISKAALDRGLREILPSP
jgi:thiol-disulfide isomerase/thioredoxin